MRGAPLSRLLCSNRLPCSNSVRVCCRRALLRAARRSAAHCWRRPGAHGGARLALRALGVPAAGLWALKWLPGLQLGELAIAFSDVVVDGVVVERSRNESQATAGSLQSICWGSQARALALDPMLHHKVVLHARPVKRLGGVQAVGRLSSAYTSGWLIDTAGPRAALAIMAVFPLAICLTAGLIREAPRVSRPPTPDAPDELQAGAPARESVEHEDAALLESAAAGARAAHGAGDRGAKRLAPHLVAQLRSLGAALATPGIYLPALFLFAWAVRAWFCAAWHARLQRKIEALCLHVQASPSAGGTM